MPFQQSLSALWLSIPLALVAPSLNAEPPSGDLTKQISSTAEPSKSDRVRPDASTIGPLELPEFSDESASDPLFLFPTGSEQANTPTSRSEIEMVGYESELEPVEYWDHAPIESLADRGRRLEIQVLGMSRSDRTTYQERDGSEVMLSSGLHGGVSIHYLPDRLLQTDPEWGGELLLSHGSRDGIEIGGGEHRAEAGFYELQVNRYTTLAESIFGDQYFVGMTTALLDDRIDQEFIGGPLNRVHEARNFLIGPTFGLLETKQWNRFRLDSTLSGGPLLRNSKQSIQAPSNGTTVSDSSTGLAGILQSRLTGNWLISDQTNLGIGFQSTLLFNVHDSRAMGSIFGTPSLGDPGLVAYVGFHFSFERRF